MTATVSCDSPRPDQVKHKVATFLLVCEIVTETEKKGLIGHFGTGRFSKSQRLPAWAPLLSTVGVLVQAKLLTRTTFFGEVFAFRCTGQKCAVTGPGLNLIRLVLAQLLESFWESCWSPQCLPARWAGVLVLCGSGVNLSRRWVHVGCSIVWCICLSLESLAGMTSALTTTLR